MDDEHKVGSNEEWTVSPWFMSPEHAERLWSMRYEVAELSRARKALEFVYPGPFCRDYLAVTARAREPENYTDDAVRRFRQQRTLARGIYGLMAPHGPVSDILALGVDLAEVLKEKPSRRWLERFQNPGQVAGAYFEAELWANALRSGVRIARVPERSGKHVGVRTPDFSLRWNEWQVGIEAKALSTAEHDMIRHEHLPLIHPLPPDDREYQIEFSEEIQSLAANAGGREHYRAMFPAAHDAIAAKKWELEEAGSPFGEHEVPGAGRITIAKRDPEFPGRSAIVSHASEAAQDEKASRLLPHLRHAASKFHVWPKRAGSVTIAVIDAPIDYNPDAVHRALAREVRSDQSLYGETDAIVWRRIAWRIDTEPDPGKTYQYFACFAMRLPWCAMPVGRLAELSRLMLASPHRLIAPLRFRERPDLVPDVAESTQVWTCEIEI